MLYSVDKLSILKSKYETLKTINDISFNPTLTSALLLMDELKYAFYFKEKRFIFC